jgi:hypothetical protein
MSCWRRYSVKASLDHLPIDLTTSNGTSRKRYSSVPPMRRLCPLKLGRPAAMAAEDILLRNSALDSGQRLPEGCIRAKRCASSTAGLIFK